MIEILHHTPEDDVLLIAQLEAWFGPVPPEFSALSEEEQQLRSDLLTDSIVSVPNSKWSTASQHIIDFFFG